jgi:hypothetical protein
MLPFTTYSILVVTLFQPRTIDISGCVHFRLGIALPHDKRFLFDLATADRLTCQYPIQHYLGHKNIQHIYLHATRIETPTVGCH